MPSKSKPKSFPTLKSVGRSLEEFRAAHDRNAKVLKKVREGVTKLGASGWLYELDFLRLCGVSVTDLARVRDQFSHLVAMTGGKNPRRVWCGSKKLAEQVRAVVRPSA